MSKKPTKPPAKPIKTMSDLARAHGLSPNIVSGRLKKGLSLEEALTRPIGARKPHMNTLENIAAKRGLTVEQLVATFLPGS